MSNKPQLNINIFR